MAFRQPTVHVHQRVYTPLEQPESVQHESNPANLEASEEWILFSPATASTIARTLTGSTVHTQRTTGRSRQSAYGSLETATHSYAYEEDGSEAAEDEEDGELDSLDSHLHEFRNDPTHNRNTDVEIANASGTAVLPTHDGLGSFRIDVLGESVQEHLYTFERYNPRRVKRRRDNLSGGLSELEGERHAEVERVRRVEEWRLEQTRALLEEIQQETRRRRLSHLSEPKSLTSDGTEEELVTMGSIEEHKVSSQGGPPSANEGESFWNRLTRRFIQDLMGIDDNILSIIFGEALPGEDDLSTTPKASHSVSLASSRPGGELRDSTWESRLLDRVAKELGLLMNQLSDHPGAFSSYIRMTETPIPYAGLPIIPEVTQDSQLEAESSSSKFDANFRPTIQIPRQSGQHVRRPNFETPLEFDPASQAEMVLHTSSASEFTKEEWEEQLDVKRVFRYLKSHFTSRPVPPTSFRDNSRLTTLNQEEVAVRAARVRRHHPLVTKMKPIDRRTVRVGIPNTPILHRRSSSSCASQSTRRSTRRNSGSSRPYWDINGSIGSGSLIASGGAWGEI